MDGCFKLLAREVERYGGAVNAFTGDGVMALFGAPLAEEDHAVRAVHAAFAIQEALEGYGAAVRERRGIDFQMRIGVNSGLVVAGGIGDQHQVEFTALGDTINLAARLQEAAPPGGVLAGESTWRAAGDAFVWRSVGPLVLKGKEEPVPAHVPVSRGDGPGRFRSAAQRGLTTFVGRDSELRQLVGAWDRAAEGRGQVVSIVGEAGLGKSRLLHEFKRELARRGVDCHEGSCFTYGEAISYLPFLEILRRLLGLEANMAHDEAGRVVDESLAGMAVPPEMAPYLVHLLGLGGESESDTISHQSGAALRVRTLEALRSVVVGRAAGPGMALVLEDVHWIDQASQEVVSAIVEAMADVPLLLVLVYRPEYLHAWGAKAYHAEITLRRLGNAGSAAMVRAVLGKSYAARVALERLSPEDSQILVQELLGTSAVPPELEELVASHTDGNPLFIEELVRDLLETGDLAKQDGRYVLARAPEALVLPSTVQGVLLARIDRLNPELRSLLQVASVVGRVFSHGLLGAVAEAGEGFDQALLQLEDLDFVYPTTLAPERQYSFKHVLAQEAVYQTLVRSRRESLHEQVGRAIEALYADRLEEFYELLAHHYGHTGNDVKAFEYLDLANRKAARANAMPEAKEYFEQAMALLDRMPDTAVNRHHRVSLVANQFLVYFLLFQIAEYLELATGYQALADDCGDEGLRGVFYKHVGHCQWLFGDNEVARETLLTAAAGCEAGGSAVGAGMTYCLLAWVHWTLGRYEDVIAWSDKALRALEQEFDPHYVMWARAVAGWAYAEQGRWADAIRECEDGVRAGTEHGDDSAACFAAFILCIALTAQGNLREAEEWGEFALRKATTLADKAWAPSMFALTWARTGREAEAIDVLAETVPVYDSIRFTPGQLFGRVYLGEAYARVGRLEEAAETLETVAAHAERVEAPFYEGSARRLLGEVIARQDPTPRGWDRAARQFDAAVALLGRIGAENELALTYAGYADLHRQRGDTAAAGRYRTLAEEIFERLGTIV
jgi:tetratricopeptide (TPR) repeat protein